ncbi:unnamed protein product [Trichogramma brassicae]|uniref:Uncharacterized protein n=1 Tax=Trichogramma brassicae TaxID=86971 RepID=A0A6H5I7E8_9HYME|nr:unnamed protein product [Trichogramma brassicae]
MIFTVCLALLAISGIGSGSSIYNATKSPPELNAWSNELHTRELWPRLAYGKKVNIDKMFDENLKTIQNLVAYYADPGHLRDMQIPINHIAEHFGYFIYLTNGSLQNLSWLERAGTCTLAYRNKVLTVDLIMSFESLSKNRSTHKGRILQLVRQLGLQARIALLPRPGPREDLGLLVVPHGGPDERAERAARPGPSQIRLHRQDQEQPQKLLPDSHDDGRQHRAHQAGPEPVRSCGARRSGLLLDQLDLRESVRRPAQASLDDVSGGHLHTGLQQEDRHGQSEYRMERHERESL